MRVLNLCCSEKNGLSLKSMEVRKKQPWHAPRGYFCSAQQKYPKVRCWARGARRNSQRRICGGKPPSPIHCAEKGFYKTSLAFGAITDSENRKHLTFSVGLMQTYKFCNRLVIAVLKAKFAFFFGSSSTWALSQHSKFVATLRRKKE